MKITQKYISEQTGVRESELSSFKTGERGLSVANINKIHHATGLSLEFLFNNVPEDVMAGIVKHYEEKAMILMDDEASGAIETRPFSGGGDIGLTSDVIVIPHKRIGKYPGTRKK